MTPRKLDAWLRTMVTEGGSDLHLASGRAPAIRTHGEIIPLEGEPPLGDADLRAILAEAAESTAWATFEREHDLDFAYSIEGVARFRGNYLEEHTGIGAVFRRVPAKVISAAELGLPPIIQSLADLESGLVLVTGPTGSGKSTTLAAIIDLINERHAKHVVTIEDPLEFVHENKQSILSHREVGRHTGSFAMALRAALRQDADVVLVGEMRDLETIALAIEGASMGALVFGTLHTSSAAKTVDRIIGAFPAEQQAQARGLLADSLTAVVSQILCKKAGGGRIAAHEILVRSSGVSGAIREGKTAMIQSIIGSGRAAGMQLMDDALAAHVASGAIDAREAYLKASDKRRFGEGARA